MNRRRSVDAIDPPGMTPREFEAARWKWSERIFTGRTSDRRRGRPGKVLAWRKRVRDLDSGEEWDDIDAAAEVLGCSPQAVRNGCCGIQARVKRRRLAYADGRGSRHRHDRPKLAAA